MKLASILRGNDRGAVTLRLGVVTAVIATSAGLGSLGLFAGPAAAHHGPLLTNVDVCHANEGKKGYTENTVSASSITNLPNGHDDHAGDIIPPYHWDDAGTTRSYAGKNWVGETTNQEIWANDCKGVSPDLELTKTSTGDALTGATGSYYLDVKNIGTQTAAGPITVSDALPGGVTATGASGADWTCSVGPVQCTYTPGSLAPGASAPRITVAVTWTTAGTKLNSATVRPVVDETATTNNTDTESDAITDPPVLSGTVVKTVDADAVPGYSANETAATQGETVDFRAVVTNTSAVAVDVGDLTDSYGAVVDAPVTCTNAPPTTLAAGASFTCDFSVTSYSPAPGGSVVNTFKATLSRTGSASVTPQGTATTRTAALIPVLSGTVAKTVDVDATPGYTEDETAVEPDMTARFRAVVTNTSGVEVTLGALTDSYAAVVDAAVTCDDTPPATLAASGAGASFTCDFSRPSYSPGYGGALVNTFKATLSKAGGSASVTPSDTATTRTGRPDLVMTKTSSGTAPAASSGSYFLDVSNTGTATAAGPLSVSDTMPAGVVATAVGGTGWTCSVGAGGGSVSCSRTADLPAGAAAEQITVSVDWGTTGEKNNSATVDPVPGEVTTGNNTDDDRTTVTAALVPDLKLTKTAPSAATTGQSGSYSLLVENVGTAAATAQITVTDTLPAGVTVTGPVTSGGFTCTVAGNVVTCLSDDDVAVAGSKTITLPATFTTVGSKANTATVTVTGDSNATNDTSVASTNVTDPAGPPPPVVQPLPSDLAVQKTGPASVSPGETATWTLTVTNKGPGNASGFSVTDTLPSGVSSTSLTGTDFTCTAATGVCTFTSVLLPGSTAVVTLVGSVAQDVAGTSLANVVVVGPTDATPEDNTDTLVSAIQRPEPAPADLVLEKSAPADPTVVGGTIAWTITVTNAGGSDAPSFELSDTLGDGLTFVSAAGDGFSCSTTEPLCTYDGGLAAGEQATLVVTTALADDWSSSSVANVAAALLEGDPTPANNSDSATAGVILPIDGGTTDPGSGPSPAPAASPLPSTLPFVDEDEDEQPAGTPSALPFTGSGSDLLLGLGAGLSVIGLMLALAGRRHRTVE